MTMAQAKSQKPQTHSALRRWMDMLFHGLGRSKPKLLEKIEEYLEPGETVVEAVWGSADPRGVLNLAVLAATDRRVILYGRGLLYGYSMSYMPYDKITLVDEGGGFTDRWIMVQSVNGMLPFSPSGRKSEHAALKNIVREIRQRMASTGQSQEGQTERKLRELKQWREEGLITEEEYQAKKAQILERI